MPINTTRKVAALADHMFEGRHAQGECRDAYEGQQPTDDTSSSPYTPMHARYVPFDTQTSDSALLCTDCEIQLCDSVAEKTRKMCRKCLDSDIISLYHRYIEMYQVEQWLWIDRAKGAEPCDDQE